MQVKQFIFLNTGETDQTSQRSITPTTNMLMSTFESIHEVSKMKASKMIVLKHLTDIEQMLIVCFNNDTSIHCDQFLFSERNYVTGEV
jgi:hypothetical protein